MPQPDQIRSILIEHQERYPLWGVQDLYKLLHQAAMGSEHAVLDQTIAREWLYWEIRDLGDGPTEPLVDPIAPKGKIVRVHLRPFLTLGYDPELLLGAFIRTGIEFKGSAKSLQEYKLQAVQMAVDGHLAFTSREIRQFISDVLDAGFPAVHHSPAFVSAYKPAYRVVAKTYLPRQLEMEKDWGSTGKDQNLESG